MSGWQIESLEVIGLSAGAGLLIGAVLAWILRRR